jgi:type IV pilus biogenesis protein CpaD/CtpE
MFRMLRHSGPARLAAIGIVAITLGGCQHTRVRQIEQTFPADYRQRHAILVGPQGAYLDHPCGQWPHDVGPADNEINAMNRPHWNHGCATQHNLAAIVANPNDLLQPRAEGPVDQTRRQTAITKYRAGASPGPQTVHSPMQPLTDVRSGVRGGG